MHHDRTSHVFPDNHACAGKLMQSLVGTPTVSLKPHMPRGPFRATLLFSETPKSSGIMTGGVDGSQNRKTIGDVTSVPTNHLEPLG